VPVFQASIVDSCIWNKEVPYNVPATPVDNGINEVEKPVEIE